MMKRLNQKLFSKLLPSLFSSALKPVRNSRGVALMIALFSMLLMIFIARSVSYDTNVEYIVSSQSVNRLKAYYAARSAVDMGLLRVLLYKKAMASFGDDLGEKKSMLDPIWNFPFAWPPSQFVGDKIGRGDKETLKSLEKESMMKSRYFLSIEAEGSKLDINDLGSSSEGLAKSTRDQILKIFTQEMDNNDDFADQYSGFDFEELVNNITDWVDEDKESLNGGDEGSSYPDANSDFVPPNQPFKTLKELHMVDKMDDELFNLLARHITVYGVKGVNVNYAPADVLKSLDPQIDDKVAQEILSRRNDPDQGPFANEKDFESFLSGFINTTDFNKDGVPLIFDEGYNFRITGTGEFANVTQEITAVTYDLDSIRDRFIDILEEDEKNAQSGGQSGQGSSGGSGQGTTGSGQGTSGTSGTTPQKPKTKKKVPKGRPTIVYWNEN